MTISELGWVAAEFRAEEDRLRAEAKSLYRQTDVAARYITAIALRDLRVARRVIGRFGWRASRLRPQDAEMRLDYWRRIIRGNTHGATTEQVERGAAMCLETENAGDPCGAWHAMATVCKTACWCARCRPDVRRFA